MAAATALQRLRERRKAALEAETVSPEESVAGSHSPQGEPPPTSSEEPQEQSLHDFYEARVAEMAETIRQSRKLHSGQQKKEKKPRLLEILRAERDRDRAKRERMDSEGTFFLHHIDQRDSVPEINLEKLQEIHRRYCPRTEYDEFSELAERMSDELDEPYTVERLVLGYGHDLDRDNHHLRIVTVEEAQERALTRRPLHEWAYTDDGVYSVPEGLLQALQANHSPEEIDTLVSVATLWKAKLNSIRQKVRQREEA